MSESSRPKLAGPPELTQRSTFQHSDPVAVSRAPPPARTPTHANWTPWLRSPPSAGPRRALPPSSVAAIAREEVRDNESEAPSKTADRTAAFHPAPASLAAQNFSMPALSPTMTEGNIAAWKIKEGTTAPRPHRAAAARTTETWDYGGTEVGEARR